MVLPSSPVTDAHAPPAGDWLQPIATALELTRRGILMLVGAIAPWGIGELLRTLLPLHPELDVHWDVRVVESLPVGTKLILVPRREDALALNMARPIFSRRELKVILACDRETSETLAKDAPDFFDWISIYEEWPEKPAPHAVYGIRRSVEVRAPGIVWFKRSEAEKELVPPGLRSALAAAFPGRTLVEMDPSGRFDEIVEAIRLAGWNWPCVQVQDPRFTRRMRWALADARRRVGSAFVAKHVERDGSNSSLSPWLAGFAPVHDSIATFEESHDALTKVGARYPGRLAALMGYESETISLCKRLLEHGEVESLLTKRLLEVDDSGALIARTAFERGLLREDECDLTRASPPVFRALAQRDTVRIAATQIDDPILIRPTHIDLEKAALQALKIGDYDAGIAWGQRVLKKKKPGKNPELWLWVGRAFSDLGNYARGLPYLRHAARTMVDVADPLYVECIIAFVRALVQLDRSSDAAVALDRAIVAVDTRFGATHESIARLMIVVAETYRRSGDFLVAEFILRRILGNEIYEPDFSKEEAEEFLLVQFEQDFPQAAWAIDEWWHRADPIGAAYRWRAVAELGEVYLWQDMQEEAQEVLSHALHEAEIQIGSEHPMLDPLRDALAKANPTIGRFDSFADVIGDALPQAASSPLLPLQKLAILESHESAKPGAKVRNERDARNFWRKYRSFIRYKLRRRGVAEADLDDAEQNIRFSIYLMPLRRKAQLYGLIRREVKRFSRIHAIKKKYFLSNDDVLDEIPDPSSSPLESYLTYADVEKLHEAMRRLPRRDRTIISMRYFDQLSIAAIAAKLNVSVAAATGRVHRAVEALRRLVIL